MVLRLAIAAGRRYLDDGMIDRAPAISYYGMLSLFCAFAGVIILLLWLWLVSGALLYGAELDAVLAEWRAGERDA
jgi:uncharacterized BrkB/YihY/UPF0761 family membrane protein